MMDAVLVVALGPDDGSLLSESALAAMRTAKRLQRKKKTTIRPMRTLKRWKMSPP